MKASFTPKVSTQPQSERPEQQTHRLLAAAAHTVVPVHDDLGHGNNTEHDHFQQSSVPVHDGIGHGNYTEHDHFQ